MFTTTDATTTNYITKDNVQGIGTTESTEKTFTTVFPTKSTSDATEKVGTLGAELYGIYKNGEQEVATEDRKSTRLNSSHSAKSRMPSSA